MRYIAWRGLSDDVPRGDRGPLAVDAGRPPTREPVLVPDATASGFEPELAGRRPARGHRRARVHPARPRRPPARQVHALPGRAARVARPGGAALPHDREPPRVGDRAHAGEDAPSATRASSSRRSCSTVDEGIIVQSAAGQIVYANESAARVIGFESAADFLAADRDEVLGRFEMLDEDGARSTPDDLPGRRALRGETSERVIRYRDKATGEERWSVVRANAVQDAAGAVALSVSVIRDVTESKLAERRVELPDAGRRAAERDARRRAHARRARGRRGAGVRRPRDGRPLRRRRAALRRRAPHRPREDGAHDRAPPRVSADRPGASRPARDRERRAAVRPGRAGGGRVDGARRAPRARDPRARQHLGHRRAARRARPDVRRDHVRHGAAAAALHGERPRAGGRDRPPRVGGARQRAPLRGGAGAGARDRGARVRRRRRPARRPRRDRAAARIPAAARTFAVKPAKAIGRRIDDVVPDWQTVRDRTAAHAAARSRARGARSCCPST